MFEKGQEKVSERKNKSKSQGRNRFGSIQIFMYGRNKIQELFFSTFNLGKAIFSFKSYGFLISTLPILYVVLKFPLLLIVYPLYEKSI